MNGLERKSRVSVLACRRARTVRRLQGSPQAFVMPDGLAYHALRSGQLSQVRRVLLREVMLRILLRHRDQGPPADHPRPPGCVIGNSPVQTELTRGNCIPYVSAP